MFIHVIAAVLADGPDTCQGNKRPSGGGTWAKYSVSASAVARAHCERQGVVCWANDGTGGSRQDRDWPDTTVRTDGVRCCGVVAVTRPFGYRSLRFCLVGSNALCHGNDEMQVVMNDANTGAMECDQLRKSESIGAVEECVLASVN